MLKYKQINLIHVNSMIVESYSGGLNHIVCGDVDEYVRYEQHRLNVVNQVIRQDLKAENRIYDHMVVMNRMYVTNM